MPPFFLRQMHKRTPSWLAVQSNGFRYEFLFSVPCELEIESFGQVPSSFVGCQVMDSAPKVERVTGCSAWRMETLEDVLAQVNGEGASSSALRAMHWAGPTTLRSDAP